MSLLRMNEQVRKTLNLCWLPMTALDGSSISCSPIPNV